MKIYFIGPDYGIEALKMSDRPEPKPGYGQALVRVRAVSLNYRDLMVVKGAYARGNVPVPLVPCSDGAGEVVAVGEGVTRVKPGDRVAAAFMQGWLSGPIRAGYAATALGGALNGMLAEYVVLNEQGLVRFPEHLDYAQAASLPCAAVTAWQALFTLGNLAPGQSVLTMGSGGVSVFALQFARMAGARVLATTSSAAKAARLRAMGAGEVIDYRAEPAWDRRVLELTGGLGVDHVVEVGGGGTLERSLRACASGGRISLIGILSGVGAKVDPLPLLLKGITMAGVYVGSRDMFEAMNAAIAQARLEPVIDRIFPWEEAAQAWRYLESGAHLGKVCIAV